MRLKRRGRDASLMQIAAAMVGTAPAAQVVAPEVEQQAHQHTYLTRAEPGVTETPWQLDVVGANHRRLIAYWAPDGGLYVGGCLIGDRSDAEALAAFILREADE